MVRYGYVRFFCWNILQNCLSLSLHGAAKFAKIEKNRGPQLNLSFSRFLQHLRKIGEIAKFTDKELGKNHQTSDFSQFSQIL